MASSRKNCALPWVSDSAAVTAQVSLTSPDFLMGTLSHIEAGSKKRRPPRYRSLAWRPDQAL
jgi:hypothetical protein